MRNNVNIIFGMFTKLSKLSVPNQSFFLIKLVIIMFPMFGIASRYVEAKIKAHRLDGMCHLLSILWLTNTAHEWYFGSYCLLCIIIANIILFSTSLIHNASYSLLNFNIARWLPHIRAMLRNTNRMFSFKAIK